MTRIVAIADDLPALPKRERPPSLPGLGRVETLDQAAEMATRPGVPA